MKVVHLTWSFGIGGAENLIVDIVNEQAKKTTVTLIIVNKQYNKQLLSRVSNQVKVHCINRTVGNKWNLLPILKLWSLLFSIKPEVIHCHDHDLIGLLFFWKQKTVITIHEMGVPIHTVRRFQKRFSISKSVQQDLSDRGNLNSIIVLNGIDFGSFRKKQDYLTRLNEFRIVQVSRLRHERKGQDVAIRALHVLVYQFGLQEISLSFIGEGPSLDYLQELASELKITPYIHFVGSKDRSWVMQELCSYEALIQPSYSEGFGLTVLEGLAAGIPVIASKTEGPLEILDNMPAGFLFDVGNSKELADCINHVVQLYEQKKIREACAASNKIAAQRYSVQQTADEYLRQYKKGIINSKSP